MPEEPASSARPGHGEVRAALENLLASKRFARAERHSRFLRYVVDEELGGRGGQLKESLLGAEVFGRPVDYDPRVDPVVRVEATKLRGRLEEYYSGEGLEDALIIEFPRGGYVPHFRRREAAAAAVATPAMESPVEEKASEKTVESPRFSRRVWITGAGVAAASFAGIAAWGLLKPAQDPVVAVLPFDAIGPESAGGACEALAAELRARLAKDGRVRVVSATSSRAAARSKPADARSLGRELDADVLVEGTVRKHESSTVVMLQLVDAPTGLSFWTGRYVCDAAMRDEGTLDRIAREVRKALEQKRWA